MVNLSEAQQWAGCECQCRRLMHHLGSENIHKSHVSLWVYTFQASSLPSRWIATAHNWIWQKDYLLGNFRWTSNQNAGWVRRRRSQCTSYHKVKKKFFYWINWSKSWKYVILVNREGEHFVSGGEDKVVKLWGYDEGICYFSGNGHSGTITRVNNLIQFSKTNANEILFFDYLYFSFK